MCCNDPVRVSGSAVGGTLEERSVRSRRREFPFIISRLTTARRFWTRVRFPPPPPRHPTKSTGYKVVFLWAPHGRHIGLGFPASPCQRGVAGSRPSFARLAHHGRSPSASPVSCSSIREPLRGVARRGFSLVAVARHLVPRRRRPPEETGEETVSRQRAPRTRRLRHGFAGQSLFVVRIRRTLKRGRWVRF